MEKVLFLIQYGYVQPGVATRTRWGIVNAEDLNEALIYAEQAAAALIDKRGQTGRPGVAPVHGAYPLDDLLQPGHHIDVDFYYE